MSAGNGWPVVGLVAAAFAATPAMAWQSASQAAETAPAKGEAAPCSPVAIRLAVARRQVPAVTGCRYDVVSAPLMQFHFMPLPTKVFNETAAGVIVGQTPPAGTPGKPGLLLLQVSKGPQPQPETPPQTEPKPEQPAQPESSATPQASESSSPAEASAPAVPAPPKPVPPPEPERPGLADAVALLWGAISAYPLPAVIAVALASVFAGLGLRGGKPARGRSGAMPRVGCELEPGASRLTASGPLVLGRKGDAR